MLPTKKFRLSLRSYVLGVVETAHPRHGIGQTNHLEAMQSNAKQCKAMQSNAKQCKAMQSNAKCTSSRSLRVGEELELSADGAHQRLQEPGWQGPRRKAFVSQPAPLIIIPVDGAETGHLKPFKIILEGIEDILRRRVLQSSEAKLLGFHLRTTSSVSCGEILCLNSLIFFSDLPAASCGSSSSTRAFTCSAMTSKTSSSCTFRTF